MTPRCKNSYGKLRHVLLAKPVPYVLEDYDPSDIEFLQFLDMPDVGLVRDQIEQYADLLRGLGVVVDMFEYAMYANQIFLRDVAIVIDDQVVLGKPSGVRSGEPHVLNRELASLGIDPVWLSYGFLDNFECADVVLTDTGVILATGHRTKIAVCKLLRHGLNGNRWFGCVPAAPVDVPQHLAGHKQPLDANTLLSRIEISSDDFGFGNVITLTETEEVVRGFASNVAVIGPREIVMPAGCDQTRKYLEGCGIVCHVTPMSEVHKMGGGLTCVTLALRRD